jgi:hypothetical protein
MDRLPFSVYDFFGYLSAGFVLLVGLAAAFTGSNAWEKSPTTIVTLLLIVLAYSSGQVVANVAGHVIERRLVGGWLKSSTQILFAPAETGPVARLFPGYFRPLPEAQQRAVLNVAAKSGIAGPGEGLFFHCFARVKREEAVMARLNTFLNLYGFCRNMSVALVVVAVCLGAGSAAGSAHTGSVVSPGWWVVGSLVIAAGLFYRYLKFFRLYAVEVYVSYADIAGASA